MPEICLNLSENDLPPDAGGPDGHASPGLAITAVRFDRVRYGPGGRFGPRTQQDIQLVMSDRGRIRVRSDGQILTFGPGEVICQWPGTHEQWHFDPDAATVHRWIQITPRAGGAGPEVPLHRTLRHWRGRMPRIVHESPTMRALFDAGFALAGEPAADAEPARRRLAAAYFLAFASQAEDSVTDAAASGGGRPDGTGVHPALVAMRRRIESAAGESVTLADLAKAAHVTPGHLTRLSRAAFNETPIRMLWAHRTSRGLDLLRRTGLTVGEIAEQVGFRSAFHFSRRIRQATGQSTRGIRAALSETGSEAGDGVSIG